VCRTQTTSSMRLFLFFKFTFGSLVFYVVVDVSFETKLLSQVCCEHAAFLILDCCVTIKNCLLCYVTQRHLSNTCKRFAIVFSFCLRIRVVVCMQFVRVHLFSCICQRQNRNQRKTSRVFFCAVCVFHDAVFCFVFTDT